jgi:hypothetical protein
LKNENFHFSYLVWAKKQGSKVGSNIIPIQVGYLKQLQQRQECILMGWGWTVDQTNQRCCFNHIVGLPQKDKKEYPLFDYEKII